jgi:CRP-like cAMP-binding protein
MLAIRALPLVADIHLDELAVVAEHARSHRVARGEALPPGIHLILAGRVVEWRAGRAFRVHGPQHVVGGIDALALTATDTTLLVEDEASTLAIGRDDLRDILEDNFGALSATLQGVAASTLRMRRELRPGAGFPSHGTGRADAAAALDEPWTRVAYLRARRWLPAARIETLGHLAREAALVSVTDGEVLWTEGEPADDVALIVRGTVACRSAAGQRFQRGAGTIVGLDEALAIDTRWYEAVAREPLTILRVTRAAILDALEDDPDTALHMLTTLARIASRLRDRVARTITRSP